MIPTHIGVVGDDLSGTAAIGAELARCGLPAHLLRHHAADHTWPAPTSALLASTDSRHLAPAAARHRAAQAAEGLVTSGTDVLIKKHDSLLRGNPAVELAGVLDGADLGPALCVFAAPTHGRTTVAGRQHLNGRPLDREMDPGSYRWSCPKTNDVHELLADIFGARAVAHIPFTLLESPEDALVDVMRERIAANSRVIVADAVTVAHLHLLVRCASRAGIRILAGSSGLGRALAASLLPSPAPVLVASGTTSTAGYRQLDRLVTVTGAIRLTQNGISPSPTTQLSSAAATVLRTGVPLIVDTSPDEMDDPSRVADLLSERVAQAVAAIHPGAVVATGGDTASAVADRLGIGSLICVDEIMPGVVDARAVNGPNAGVRIVIKPGSYGAEDVLVNIVERVNEPCVESSARPTDLAPSTCRSPTT